MTQTNPMRIYIEGNIGSGKTTFCKYLQEYFKGRDIGIVLEPLDRWLNTKDKEGNNSKADYIFEPSEETLILELMPKILNTQVYKAILDANASEHGARMTAMDKASENANELLKSLKISYNRARQAAITTELTEIVSGAAALQG